ncbi:group II intron reverse transcriptase/maturase [Desertivirga brevis]|uniref:group II intron reverse transcriptase/maturase n=1 Tax=Desertivirga brevis TaxID=2810310 RepID=UPI001A971799
MLEAILDIRNVQRAFRQVTANKGSAGTDGMQTEDLRSYLNAHWQTLRKTILEGNYRPLAVRKVEIPKKSGGTRTLGIPTVVDRLVSQSISQWLMPLCEREFSDKSYGFRPGRNAHQAVEQARAYLQEGYTWIIELDLEKFFDKVNHDKLMSALSLKIKDKETLRLIRSYLKAGIMDKGLMRVRREGTPQGSPLSPLLSNIVLDKLDKELEKRGHRYVRYADDCSIYVRSEKAAYRVMESIISYIETKLKLKVNREKTKVSRPTSSSLLGFSFYWSSQWHIRLSPSTLESIKGKVRSCTRRNYSGSIMEIIGNLESIIRGWVNYFKLAKASSLLKKLDEMTRIRLRMILWKQWKKASRRMRELQKLGVPKEEAYKWSYCRKGYCRVAHSKVLCVSLNNAYFSKLKYTGFANYYHWKTKHQTKLF